MATRPSRTAFQTEGARIFRAKQAAERMLGRVSAERGAVMSLSRDELAAMAQQMVTVTEIAQRYHLERATAGSLPPDAFPGPAA